MAIKKRIKTFYKEHSPLYIAHRNQLRASLKNKDFTFLCPNCIGGILLHDLGLPFNSPTINLMMLQRDFVQFALYTNEYLQGEFTGFKHTVYECPCAHLQSVGGYCRQ